jgi:hypothetical protein
MTQPIVMLCKGIINEGSCNNKVKQDEFCHLHYVRGTLLEEAKQKDVRICDDAKRACKNETFNCKSKCEDCLRKSRERETKQYEERKTKNCCVTCGNKLEEEVKGIKGSPVYKCKECYEKERSIELKRTRVKRNEKSDNKLNLALYFEKYKLGASTRNLEFSLSFEEFQKLVESPCYYCKKYNDIEVVGIDRINSSLGYISANVYPSCETCNKMKGSLSIYDFAKQIITLYETFAIPFQEEKKDEELLHQEASPSRRLRLCDISSLYINRQLKKYIDLCITDKRPQVYVDKLVTATEYKMTKDEFIIYLRKISRSEIRGNTEIPDNVRQRVPRNEIKALLAAKKVIEAVKIYESVWGHTKSIREDFTELSENWHSLEMEKKEESLQRLFIKYGNRRSYAKLTKISKPETTLTSESIEETNTKIDETSESISEINTETQATSESSKEIKPIPIEANPFTQTLPKIEKKESSPTQWKISNIYSYCMTGKEEIYLNYLKESNPDVKDIEERFTTLLAQIKTNEKEKAEKLIQEFVHDLRRLRHNALCYTKNHSVLDRDDREVWRAESVLHAFEANRLEEFKKFTEENTGDKEDDPDWMKRWESFVEGVKGESEIPKKKSMISKFLTAQRTKKYRRGKD